MASLLPTFRRLLAACAAPLAAALLNPAALAQEPNWPTKPVTLVVPFAAGGTTDIVARMLAQKLGAMWNQSVVVDNRVGAGGNIGSALVAKAPPDGYMVLVASGSILTVNPHLYPKMAFNVQKDFLPITSVASGPMVVVVPTAFEAKSMGELIARAKAAPRSIHFGSAGIGSQVHMAGENLAYAAGVDMVHVPYRGESPAYADLMAGQVQVVVGNIGAVSGLLPGGRMRALAVTGKERSKLMPEVPTVAESGLPGFENTGWFGLLAPAGTPSEIAEKIRRDTVKVLAMPDVVEKLASQGMVPIGNSPAEFRKAIDEESKIWAKVVQTRKITVEGQ